MTQKLCKNCIYYLKPSLSESIGGGYKFAKCGHPYSGKIKFAENQRKYLENEFCGPEGRWFKKKGEL